MLTSSEFVQAAGEPLRRARTELEEAISGLSTDEAFLQLRLDFEEVLQTEHGINDRARALIFQPLEALPTDSARLEQLLHMCSSYVVAREFGLVSPVETNPRA